MRGTAAALVTWLGANSGGRAEKGQNEQGSNRELKGRAALAAAAALTQHAQRAQHGGSGVRATAGEPPCATGQRLHHRACGVESARLFPPRPPPRRPGRPPAGLRAAPRCWPARGAPGRPAGTAPRGGGRPPGPRRSWGRGIGGGGARRGPVNAPFCGGAGRQQRGWWSPDRCGARETGRWNAKGEGSTARLGGGAACMRGRLGPPPRREPLPWEEAVRCCGMRLGSRGGGAGTVLGRTHESHAQPCPAMPWRAAVGGRSCYVPYRAVPCHAMDPPAARGGWGPAPPCHATPSRLPLAGGWGRQPV